MSNVGRVAAQAANTLTTPLNVEDVFSTYLYTGTANTAPNTITNGIDLSAEGGLTWFKSRNYSSDHVLYDTERGVSTKLVTNSTAAQVYASGQGVTSFNSDGFTLTTGDGDYNASVPYASWTFRKAPKFFDVVTYTGDGTSYREIAHNLGSVPGSVWIKRTDATSDWVVYHRTLAQTWYYLKLNSTSAVFTSGGAGSGNHTATDIEVGYNFVNTTGGTYVAYLFAHNDGDGDFGPTGDQDIIKCGSFTSPSVEVDLGFEPQWILVKRTNTTSSWYLVDTMRGIVTGGDDQYLEIQTSGIENPYDIIDIRSNGFYVGTGLGSGDWVYIAIRRGPMAVPESATEVFAMDTFGNAGSAAPSFTSNFPVDMAIWRTKNSTNNTNNAARLISGKYLRTNLTNAEAALTQATFDFMDGYYNIATSTDVNTFAWMWKRAPNFFDVVAYTGNGVAGRTVSHNLGVAPEMMWVKNRSQTQTWAVYHKDLDTTAPEDYYLQLQTTNARINTSAVFGAQPTDTVFTVDVASSVNQSGQNIIAYLFASLDGVSKVGSFSHTNGTDTNVDCGFSSGARFVLLKRYDDASNWHVFDSERGIVSGNDPLLYLNLTNAESTSSDLIDPYSAGFTFSSVVSTGDWIYYAIA